MEISKLKAIICYVTGGLAGVIEYLLEQFNALIQKLPTAEVAKYAQLAKDIANFVMNIANTLITNAQKREAAIATAAAFDKLATALLDANIDKQELELIIDSIKAAIEAWKEAK